MSVDPANTHELAQITGAGADMSKEGLCLPSETGGWQLG
jgi:hypothetical protein